MLLIDLLNVFWFKYILDESFIQGVYKYVTAL